MRRSIADYCQVSITYESHTVNETHHTCVTHNSRITHHTRITHEPHMEHTQTTPESHSVHLYTTHESHTHCTRITHKSPTNHTRTSHESHMSSEAYACNCVGHAAIALAGPWSYDLLERWLFAFVCTCNCDRGGQANLYGGNF